MGFIKTRKSKKFSYNPRYFDDKGEGSPFQIEHKFDKFRTTVGDSNGLKGKFMNVWHDLRDSSNRNSNRRVLIIISLLVLIFLLIIDFDLSIFLKN